MSVSSAAPQDFVEWLKHDTGSPVDPDAFVPRASFGRYVSDRLETVRRQARPKSVLVRHSAEVLDIERCKERAVLHLSDGSGIEADAVVLALGNAQPRRLPFFPRAGTNPMFCESAWQPEALTPPDPDSPVVLIGSGLTAVDAFIGLRANGHRGIIHMISRRGLLPQPHARSTKSCTLSVPLESRTLRELLRELRNRAHRAEQSGSNWRDVIGSLRGATNDLWLGLTPRDRERFYRHLKPYWDVHRHRMAPEVAAVVENARRAGTLHVHAGRIQRILDCPDKVKIEVRLRSQEAVTLCAQRVINCTGSEQDYRRVDSQLLRSLLRKGWLQSNPQGIGIRAAENGKILPWLYTIGPMRIGGLLETTAVPEIREQAAALAKTLLEAPARDLLFPTAAQFSVGAFSQ